MLHTQPHGQPQSLFDRHASSRGRGAARPTRVSVLSRVLVLMLATGAAINAGMILVSVSPAGAQQGQRVAINIAPVMLAEPGTRTPLPIQIDQPEAAASHRFLRFRGLPPSASLSEGHAISPGVWAVPIIALPTLALIVPSEVQGRFDFTVALVAVDGTVLTQAKAALVVAAVPQVPPAAPNRQEAPANVASLGPPIVQAPSPERDKANAFHAKGQEQLDRGNVYAARKFFERAAEAGLAQSALALAGTYDPHELAKYPVFGLQPDVDAAKKWYEKARALGASEAVARLQRLTAR